MRLPAGLVASLPVLFRLSWATASWRLPSETLRRPEWRAFGLVREVAMVITVSDGSGATAPDRTTDTAFVTQGVCHAGRTGLRDTLGGVARPSRRRGTASGGQSLGLIALPGEPPAPPRSEVRRPSPSGAPVGRLHQPGRSRIRTPRMYGLDRPWRPDLARDPYGTGRLAESRGSRRDLAAGLPVEPVRGGLPAGRPRRGLKHLSTRPFESPRVVATRTPALQPVCEPRSFGRLERSFGRR